MDSITARYPELNFAQASQFLWSPRTQTVFYDQDIAETATGQLALLHEIGHAELGHTDYILDIELLGMEVDAWGYARRHSLELGIAVDEEHVERCLESYRIWLYKRSLCPHCSAHGLQIDKKTYRCFMCRHQWRVARSLTLQPRRRQCRSCHVDVSH